jgi:hypothetical protein
MKDETIPLFKEIMQEYVKNIKIGKFENWKKLSQEHDGNPIIEPNYETIPSCNFKHFYSFIFRTLINFRKKHSLFSEIIRPQAKMILILIEKKLKNKIHGQSSDGLNVAARNFIKSIIHHKISS